MIYEESLKFEISMLFNEMEAHIKLISENENVSVNSLKHLI